MNFTSRSQAGQDEFIFRLIKPHTFLDVGCSDPVQINNTIALEEMGWVGFSVDVDPRWAEAYREKRKCPFICADATTIDWTKALGGQKLFDYLSLDVDEAQVAALKNLLAHGIRFRAATVEHDGYRFGNGPRDEIRALLTAAGYTMLNEDVYYGGVAYEDWWADQKAL